MIVANSRARLPSLPSANSADQVVQIWRRNDSCCPDSHCAANLRARSKSSEPNPRPSPSNSRPSSTSRSSSSSSRRGTRVSASISACRCAAASPSMSVTISLQGGCQKDGGDHREKRLLCLVAVRQGLRRSQHGVQPVISQPHPAVQQLTYPGLL